MPEACLLSKGCSIRSETEMRLHHCHCHKIEATCFGDKDSLGSRERQVPNQGNKIDFDLDEEA